MANLSAALEAGTDPSLVNPRLNQLQAERDLAARRLAELVAPNLLSPEEIEQVLGGLAGVLRAAATLTEKVSIYQELGLHLVYQPTRRTHPGRGTPTSGKTASPARSTAGSPGLRS